MTIPKSIVYILIAVLLLTVVSGVILMYGGDQSGGITSLSEPKYDHVVDNSLAHVKYVSSGARNGELKTVGSICYEYSKVLLNVTPNQTVGQTSTEITDPNGALYLFILETPLEITITASGAQAYNVYLCWQSETGDPEDPPKRHYVGSGSQISVDEYPPEYGSEYCWIEIESPRGNVTIRRIVVQMVPEVDESSVTSVIATSKNLIDYRYATLRDGTALDLVDDGVVMPEGASFYIVFPVDLPSGSYTVTYIGDNDSGDCVGKYVFEYVDGTYSTQFLSSGMSAYHGKSIKSLWIYKADPTVPLLSDLVISNIMVESGTVATEYTPYFDDKTILSIPSAVLNLPGYGVGSGYLYNYIDLSRGVYVQTCKIDGTDVVALDEPREYDISAYFPPGSGKVDLYGVGSLTFVNAYGLDVPSELSYRRLISSVD